jgi:hypothetical protein
MEIKDENRLNFLDGIEPIFRYANPRVSEAFADINLREFLPLDLKPQAYTTNDAIQFPTDNRLKVLTKQSTGISEVSFFNGVEFHPMI